MNGKKLLVADDSLTIQKVIRLALSNEGYEIQTVSDGNDAVQQIALFQPDLVLIDVSLPGKSAFEVKTLVDSSKDLPSPRFVLMSSAFEKVDEKQVADGQFAGRLTKPFDPAHLRKVLSEALKQVQQAPQRVTEPLMSAPIEAPETPSLGQAIMDENWPELGQPVSDPVLPPPLPGIPKEFQIENAQLAPTAGSTQPTSQEVPMLNDLWDKESEILMPPPPPSMPTGLPPGFATSSPPKPAGMPTGMPKVPSIAGTKQPGSPVENDSDIRHLTESTIRMSGLDDFQWSVNEPSLKPPPGLLERPDTTFDLDPGSAPSSVPLSAPLGAPSFLNSAFDRTPAETPDNIQVLETHAPVPVQGPGISKEEIEEIVKRELQKAVSNALEKFAQKMLPEVAERVIKEEIHRMLSEQP